MSSEQRFADLLARLKQTDVYWQEKAKSEVSDRIDEAMREQGISKAELARRLKVSRSYITKILSDENLTIASLVRIGRALNCELSISLTAQPEQAND